MTRIVGTDNASFWNRRYSELPELGSGPGSRGYAIFFKRNLIRSILQQYDVKSILDVGCGDLSFLDDALFSGKRYVGVDISEVIVERNARRFPGARFLCHDVSKDPLPLRADLVISFDVLIHQLSRAAFDTALSNTLDAIDIVGVFGYSTPPRPDGTAPDFVPADLAGEELEHERALNEILRNTAGRRVGMGTAYYGPFESLVSHVRPAMETVPAGVYRDNTAYRVLPNPSAR
ncbi:MAG: hypothetical protein NVSMB64_05620 [Candidatus Velthaea sp.]